MLSKAQEGVPPFSFVFCVCAVTLGGGRWPCCDSTPFLWCLPKETVSSRQRKALFYLGGSTIRVSAPASVFFTHLHPTWGGGWWLSEHLPSPGANVTGCGRFARVVELAGVTVVISFRLPPKRVSLGLHPVSLRKSKEMGWNGQGQRGLLPNKTAHKHEGKTRSFPLAACKLKGSP